MQIQHWKKGKSSTLMVPLFYRLSVLFFESHCKTSAFVLGSHKVQFQFPVCVILSCFCLLGRSFGDFLLFVFSRCQGEPNLHVSGSDTEPLGGRESTGADLKTETSCQWKELQSCIICYHQRHFHQNSLCQLCLSIFGSEHAVCLLTVTQLQFFVQKKKK